MHAAFAEWCRLKLYLLGSDVFEFHGKIYYKLHIPPIFCETAESEVMMITCLVVDMVDQGHRMIVLCPGPDMPSLESECPS